MLFRDVPCLLRSGIQLHTQLLYCLVPLRTTAAKLLQFTIYLVFHSAISKDVILFDLRSVTVFIGLDFCNILLHVFSSVNKSDEIRVFALTI